MAEVKLERNKAVLEKLCAAFPSASTAWRYFVSLCEVPHPSGHTRAASDWCAAAGAALGGKVIVDSVGNVAVRFPATPGKESAPAVVLQAHIDMVPTKAEDLVFDFTKDQIVLDVDGGVIRARGTTLGADDGSGVAVALAIAADKSVARGPLELLFTIDEEIGMIGANKMVPGELISPAAKFLVNVDSEEFGELTVSCAGSAKRELRIPLQRAPHDPNWVHFQMKIKDLKGGHSGIQIQLGRANAIKCASVVLLENKASLSGAPFRVTSFAGGHAHNAIPSSCTVELSVPSDRAADFIDQCKRLFDTLRARYAHTELSPAVEFTLLPAGPSAQTALTVSSSKTAMRFIESLHHGVWAWSESCVELVETSQSLARAGLDNETFWAEIYARSSKNEMQTAMSNLMDVQAALYNGTVVRRATDMPGWPANIESALCKKAQSVFKKEFGKEIKVAPIHAGLECGVILNKFPENALEAISVGPTVHNPHTTNEYMDLESCVKLHRYLTALLEELAN